LKTIKIVTFRITILFVFLYIISVPIGYNYIFDIGNYSGSFFEIIVKYIGDHVLHINAPYTPLLISDSTGLYIHIFVLLTISAIAGILFSLLCKQTKNEEQIKYWFSVIICYYLSLQLFRYGFDKLFKHQFYFPEPNILYTPLGYLSKDILYWSTMGSSYWYTVFSGLLEIIPAVLLLFKRTRQSGAIIALLVMTNVVMINFGFDISVKVHSSFLLLLCIIVALPGIKKLYNFFILHKLIHTEEWHPKIDSKNKTVFYQLSKAVVISCILFESLFIYFKMQNFNDDTAERPFLHGAYSIELFIRNNDTILPILTDSTRIKRFFIHRNGYFIFQNMIDEMDDYQLNYDFENRQLILTGYNNSKIIFDYVQSEKDDVLMLSGKINNSTIKMKARQIDLSKLPLLEKGIHFTIDDY